MQSVYAVGIGGIGVSALAQWLRARGATVGGCDRSSSPITNTLLAVGIPVAIPEPRALPDGVDLLLYSDAVPTDHPLRVAARTDGVPERSYAALLGELLRAFRTVAVAGSHGKSTTAALAGLLLEAAGSDPTVIVGTQVPSWRRPDLGLPLGNIRLGDSDVAVCEADEYREHFLELRPAVAIITSIDHDHVDAFPTPAAYREAFLHFLATLRPPAVAVLCASDPAVLELRPSLRPDVSVLTYALGVKPAAADVVATPPSVRDGVQTFAVFVRGTSWGGFALHVPGEHVVLNAAGAIAATLGLGVDVGVARAALVGFRGIWRRFEHVGTFNGAPVISDYAHHPTELQALLAAARAWYPGKRLVIAFQPHQPARARAFSLAFLDTLSNFDRVVLADVYGVAGRDEDRSFSTRAWAEDLQARGRDATFAGPLDAVVTILKQTTRPTDALLVVGAGDIDDVARTLVR